MAPDQRHVRGQLLRAAPLADLLVGEVQLPAGVGLGRLVGVVGASAEGRRLTVLTVVERDIAVDLEALAGARRRRDVGSPLQRPFRIPVDVPRVTELVALLGIDLAHGVEEQPAQLVGPAAVRQRVVWRLGDEAGNWSLLRRHLEVLRLLARAGRY